MNHAKKKRLESKDWKVGDAKEFLNLSPEEAAYVEMKLALGRIVHEFRKRKKMTQQELARRLKSSQSRVAKMESGDPSVSLDLLFRSLFALGASRKNVVQMLS